MITSSGILSTLRLPSTVPWVTKMVRGGLRRLDASSRRILGWLRKGCLLLQQPGLSML